jgi:cell volume regulation protein A
MEFANQIFLVAAAWITFSIFAGVLSSRVGAPLLLVFLAFGMLAGEDGIGGIVFQDFRLAYLTGSVALALILFDGGLNTDARSLRSVLAPAGVLATIGVAGTALLTAVGARALGSPWGHALLLGAIVSSTDAAAVFSALRNAGVRVRPRVAHLLEVESGGNDPMAVILTLAVTQVLASGEPVRWTILLDIAIQLSVGLAAGVAIGLGGRWLLRRAHLAASGLYPVLTLSIALFAFGAPTLLWGSGFVAVYAAGITLGAGQLPYLPGLRRVHDAMAWFSQVAMFLLLGLLVFPSRVAAVAGPGLAIGLLLAFVARPLVVWLMLLPFRLPAREVIFVSWVGLRGAVPIMLATTPVLAGLPFAEHVFDLVFFVVVVSTVVQGSTIACLARKLGLETAGPPPPRAVLEIVSSQQLGGEVASYYVEPASAVAGSRISELPFPEGSTVMLVVRGRELVAAIVRRAVGYHVKLGEGRA